jgi:hypothetical protein
VRPDVKSARTSAHAVHMSSHVINVARQWQLQLERAAEKATKEGESSLQRMYAVIEAAARLPPGSNRVPVRLWPEHQLIEGQRSFNAERDVNLNTISLNAVHCSRDAHKSNAANPQSPKLVAAVVNVQFTERKGQDREVLTAAPVCGDCRCRSR